MPKPSSDTQPCRRHRPLNSILIMTASRLPPSLAYRQAVNLKPDHHRCDPPLTPIKSFSKLCGSALAHVSHSLFLPHTSGRSTSPTSASSLVPCQVLLDPGMAQCLLFAWPEHSILPLPLSLTHLLTHHHHLSALSHPSILRSLPIHHLHKCFQFLRESGRQTLRAAYFDILSTLQLLQAPFPARRGPEIVRKLPSQESSMRDHGSVVRTEHDGREAKLDVGATYRVERLLQRTS